MSDDWFSQYLYRKVPMHVQNDSVNHALDRFFGDDKNRWRYDVAGLPFIGTYYRAIDQKNYWNDYMSNRGLSWSAAKYPTMMPGAGSVGRSVLSDLGAFASGSKTLGRLYEGMKQDHGDWIPSKQPQSFQPSNVGIRRINGRGQFYRWDY